MLKELPEARQLVSSGTRKSRALKNLPETLFLLSIWIRKLPLKHTVQSYLGTRKSLLIPLQVSTDTHKNSHRDLGKWAWPPPVKADPWEAEAGDGALPWETGVIFYFSFETVSPYIHAGLELPCSPVWPQAGSSFLSLPASMVKGKAADAQLSLGVSNIFLIHLWLHQQPKAAERAWGDGSVGQVVAVQIPRHKWKAGYRVHVSNHSWRRDKSSQGFPGKAV